MFWNRPADRLTSLSVYIQWLPNFLHAWVMSDWGVIMAGDSGLVPSALSKLDQKTATQGEVKDAITESIANTMAYLALLATRLELTEKVETRFRELMEKC